MTVVGEGQYFKLTARSDECPGVIYDIALRSRCLNPTNIHNVWFYG